MINIFKGGKSFTTTVEEYSDDKDGDTGRLMANIHPLSTVVPHSVSDLVPKAPDKSRQDPMPLYYDAMKDRRASIDLSHITDKKLRRNAMYVLQKHERMYSGSFANVLTTHHRIVLRPVSIQSHQLLYCADPDTRAII